MANFGYKMNILTINHLFIEIKFLMLLTKKYHASHNVSKKLPYLEISIYREKTIL